MNTALLYRTSLVEVNTPFSLFFLFFLALLFLLFLGSPSCGFHLAFARSQSARLPPILSQYPLEVCRSFFRFLIGFAPLSVVRFPTFAIYPRSLPSVRSVHPKASHLSPKAPSRSYAPFRASHNALKKNNHLGTPEVVFFVLRDSRPRGYL